MPVTDQEVRALLSAEEPDYAAAARLGPDALPALRRFVESGDPNLASKATYLAGLIGDPQSAPILLVAAASPNPVLRVAAASGAAHLPASQGDAIVLALLDDAHPGVRKTALKSVPARPSPALAAKLTALRNTEAVPALRQLAGEVADRTTGTS